MLRIRMRWLIAAVALLAMLATTLLAMPAIRSALAASNQAPEYLALGDSVAFGTSELLIPSAVNPHRFIGYPTPVADGVDEPLTNAACPGETSTHFIDNTSLNDNGCGAYPGPLHVNVSYADSGTESQLAFTVSFLKQHTRAKLVSISIGANDLFVLIHGCGGSTTPAEIACILAGIGTTAAPGPLLVTLSRNLSTIYSDILGTGFHGRLVALTYYSLNYSDPVGTGVIAVINQVVTNVTHAYGGKVADGFGAFDAASAAYGGDTCAAGLVIALPSGGCGIHPSELGRNLLAQAVLSALA